MDKEVIRRQIADELQSQFETKLREVKRQKSHAEEELESASERWRGERRRMNAEIDRLEAALAEAKEPKKGVDKKSTGIDPQELERVKNVAADKLKSATAEWDEERVRLTSQISRLEKAVAEAIERSSNPIRSTQPLKEQFEVKLQEAEKDRLTLEQGFLRAKAEWDEDKKKLTGEIIKLRRLAPPSKAMEAKEKMEQLRGRTDTVEEARIKELETKLEQANAEIQKYHQTATSAKDEARNTYEPRLAEAYRDRVKLEEELANQTKQSSLERHELQSQVAQLQHTLIQAKNHESQDTAAEQQWIEVRAQLQAEITQLKRTLAETRDNVSSSVVEQIRRQYDQKIQDMIQQKTQLSQELLAASSMLEAERGRFAVASAAGTSTSRDAVDSSAISAEVERIERKLLEISSLIDDPSTELSTVIRKNVEKAELDAYLRGILFSLGRGKAL